MYLNNNKDDLDTYIMSITNIKKKKTYIGDKLLIMLYFKNCICLVVTLVIKVLYALKREQTSLILCT